MAFTILFNQVIMTRGTEDRNSVVNTWVTREEDLSPEEAALLAQARLPQFYNRVNETGLTVARFLSGEVLAGFEQSRIRTFEILDLTGTPPSMVPVSEALWTTASHPAGFGPVPAQAAVTVSFHGPYAGRPENAGATRPKQRRRGRFYFGPLNNGALDVDPLTGAAEISQTFRETLAQAATYMIDTFPDFWCGWSRKDAEVWPVIGGHIDNAVDVLRSRRWIANERELWGEN